MTLPAPYPPLVSGGEGLDCYPGDASALATFRFSQGPKADDLLLLPDIISKEPLGPMIRRGDDQWLDITRWALTALVEGAARS